MVRIDAGAVLTAQDQTAIWQVVVREVRPLRQSVRVACDATGVRHRRIFLDAPPAAEQVLLDRTLPTVLGGPEGVVQGRTPRRLPQWTATALVVPTPQATALTDLPTTRSAGLDLWWRGARVSGVLTYEPTDTELLTALRAQGWRIRPLPGGLARMLVPFLAEPTTLVPQLPLADAVRGAAPRVPDASIMRPAHTSMQDGDGDGVAAVSAPLVVQRGAAPLLAAPADPGLMLGIDAQGHAVRLAWRGMRVGIGGNASAQTAVAQAVITRALGLETGHGHGVLAVVPRRIADALRSSTVAARLRWLDADDPYASSAIALTARPASDHAATDGWRDDPARATPRVRSLTAAPGDDLAGVVNAGGGVILVLDDPTAVDAAFLVDLLWAAVVPHLMRTPVVITPGTVVVPEALGGQVLQLVLDPGPVPCHVLVRPHAEGWMLMDADATPLATLQADLWAAAVDQDATVVPTMAALIDGAAATLPQLAPVAMAWTQGVTSTGATVSAPAPPHDPWTVDAHPDEDPLLSLMRTEHPSHGDDVPTPTGLLHDGASQGDAGRDGKREDRSEVLLVDAVFPTVDTDAVPLSPVRSHAHPPTRRRMGAPRRRPARAPHRGRSATLPVQAPGTPVPTPLHPARSGSRIRRRRRHTVMRAPARAMVPTPPTVTPVPTALMAQRPAPRLRRSRHRTVLRARSVQPMVCTQPVQADTDGQMLLALLDIPAALHARVDPTTLATHLQRWLVHEQEVLS